MRRKLFRWPLMIAALCGVLLFTLTTPVLQQTAHAQNIIPPAQQDVESPTLECEILSANPANWIVCPMVVGLQESVTGLNKAIDAMLTIKLDDPNNPQTGGLFNETYKKAWDQFRIIAIGIIIIAGLIMLASQAFGFELLDAYTVRKVLPRLVIAIIFISISWDLLKFLVGLSNDAGNSVRAIIYQPFQQSIGQSGFGTALQLGNWTTFVGALIGGAALVTLGIAALLSFVATAALAVFVAFLILLARQMVITILVLIAPFAIACYVLPNTQKVFDFWKGTLISMLVVFPIISAMIATGRIFALIAYSNTQPGNISVIQQLTAFAAFFIPYLMLPFAFRLAGGAIATIAGIANDRGRGGFDRLKGYRQTKASENVAAMKAGERYKGNNAISRKFNSGTFRAGLGVKGRLGFGEQGKAAMEQRATLLGMAHSKTDDAQAAQYNDPLLQAQTYKNEHEARARMITDFGMATEDKVGKDNIDKFMQQHPGTSRSQAIQSLADQNVEQAVSAAKANGGFSKSRQMYATNQLAATGTGYDNQEQMLKTIARVAEGNDNTLHGLVGSSRGLGEKAGRYDLKAGFGTQVKLAQQASNNNGVINSKDMLAANVEAAQGVSAAQRAQSKPTATKNSVIALNKALAEANNTANNRNSTFEERRGAQETAASIVATLQNMEGAKMYGPEQYAKALYHKDGGLESSREVTQNIVNIENKINTPTANPANQNAADTYRQQAHPRYRGGRGDPNDPNDPNVPAG